MVALASANTRPSMLSPPPPSTMPMAVVAAPGWVDGRHVCYGGLMALLSIVILAFVGYPSPPRLQGPPGTQDSERSEGPTVDAGRKAREVRSSQIPKAFQDIEKGYARFLSLDIMIKGSHVGGSLLVEDHHLSVLQQGIPQG